MVTFWPRYSALLDRYRWLCALLSLVLIAGAFHYARHLRIYSDFKRMLPQDYQSVVELERIEARVKSTTNLVLLVGGDDWPAMRRFIDDFVAQVPQQLGDMIDRVEYNGKAIGDFFDKNKYLYVDQQDLEEIYDRLQRQINYEKIRRTGFYVELGEPPQFDIHDIEAKYRQQTTQYDNYRDGYFTNVDATLAAVVLKPKAGATDVEFAKQLIGRVRATADALHPSAYHQSIQIAFGGRFPKIITEFETVVGDMLRTLVLCVVLIGSVVFVYFRRLRIGALMISTAATGTLLALAVAQQTIGYLTAQTAFLGSIIIGNGINYGLILMARYLEERRDRSHGPADAIRIAMTQTWRPTLASALTTAASFGALGITDIRGLSQFGFIGGLGIILCWVMTFTGLPPWLLITERVWPITLRAAEKKEGGPFRVIMRPLSRFVTQHCSPILWAASVTAGLSLLLVGWYVPNSLEYDFNQLRFKPMEKQATWEAWARDHADDIFGQSASPAVIVADRLDQVPDICRAIEQKAAHLFTTDGQPIFDECKSLLSYVPDDQQNKLATLTRLRRLIKDQPLDFLTPDQRAEVDKFLQTADLRPVVLADLPETIVDNFRESDGRTGLVIYVYPTRHANLWDGRELVKFASLIREIPLAGGETLHASGEAAIFSDLLQAVRHEGPLATGCSFVLVLLLIWLAFYGQRHGALLVMASLGLGILWMIGWLPIMRVKLNFLNFVALPIAFGIGVDYAVNIYQRYVQDGPGSVPHAVVHVGGAVFLCSLTTMLGYSVLMISHNRGLSSLGLASLLGEISCLTAALVVLPAFLTWRERLGRAIS